MTVAFVIAISLISLISVIWVAHTQQRQRRDATTRARSEYIRKYAFPVALRLKMRERFPALGDEQISDVFEALRNWFLLLLAHRGRHLGMPSKAVDVAWHEFILMTRQYEAFCKEAFGSFLHHAPNEGSPEDSRYALSRTLGASTLAGVGAGAFVGTVAASQLFSIDQQLGIADGHLYSSGELQNLHAIHDEAMRRMSSGDGGSGGGYVLESNDEGRGSDGGGDGGDGGGGCGGCGS
jgi:hypothetical protein